MNRFIHNNINVPKRHFLGAIGDFTFIADETLLYTNEPKIGLKDREKSDRIKGRDA